MSANLAVGIKTDGALKSLRELKAALQSELKGIVVQVDATSIDTSIAGYLRQRKFKIAVDTRSLSSEIENDVGLALDNAFSRKERHLSWNQAALRGGINAAVEAAFNVKERRLQFDKAALTNEVRASIEAGGAGAILKLGVVGTPGAVAAPAASAISPQLATQIAQALSPAVDELARAAALVGGTARKVGITGSGGATTASSGFSYKDPNTGETTSYRKKLSDPNAALGAINTGNAELAAEKQKLDDLRLMHKVAVAERINDERDALTRARASSPVSARQLLGLPSEAEARAAGAQIAAQMRKGADEYSAIYEGGKFAAAGKYNGTGTRIAGASALVGAAGPDAARTFLGSKSYLVDEIKNLDDYKLKLAAIKPEVEAYGDAHKKLNGVLTEGRSAVRGFAGSLGLMWATFGSIAPLVAAAAIGTALRSVFTVGKDVEYQLAFVSALSDNASVSISKFGDAMKGSLVVPTQAAEAMRGLAQNGLSVAESLRALPSILSLATAGELSLSEAALGATGVMAAFNLTVGDLGHIGDVFAKAAAISNTSVQGMVESMKQASVVGDEFGISLEETAASLAILAKRNIIGTAAGTSFRNMVQELYTPTKKAKEALAEMGVVLTENGQFVGYSEGIKRIRDASLSLDEASRASFLGDVFNKKGDKAIGALVANFKEFGEALDEVSNKSKGFTQEVTDALGATTAGKLKQLVSEFELAGVRAFDNVAGSAGGLANQLRVLVGSNEFQTFLTNTISGVVSLTRFLLDHAQAIGTVVAAYSGFKIIVSIGEGLLALRAAYTAASAAAAIFGATSATALAAATGGLSVLLAAAAAYFLLRDRTTEAERAQRDFTNTLSLAKDATEAATRRLDEENGVLQRQIDLQYRGVDAINARLQAEGKVQRKPVEDALGKAQGDLAAIQAEREKNAVVGPNSNAFARQKRDGELDAQEKAARERITEAQKTLAAVEDRTAKTSLNDALKARADVLRKVEEFNNLLAERKGVLPGIKTQPIVATDAQSVDAIKAELKARQADLDKNQLNKYTPVDKSAQAAARSLAKSELAETISGMKNEEQEAAQYIKFRKAIDDARYNPTIFGDYVASVLAEQRAINETSQLLDTQRDHILKLVAAKKDSRLSEADRVGIDKELASEESRYLMARRALDQQKQIAAFKAQNAQTQGDNDFNKTAAELAAKAGQDRTKLSESYSNKAIDPAVAAANKASFAVEAEYRTQIVKAQEKLTNAEAAEKSLISDRNALLSSDTGYREEDVDAINAAISATGALVAQEKTRLTILQAQASSQSALSAANARKEYQNAQTAEYGWDKFWANYIASAESAATQVENLMKTATGSMTQSFSTFVTTGKLDFKSLTASILSEAAKLLASKVIAQLLQIGLSLFGGATGSSFNASGTGTGAGAAGGSAGSGVGAVYSANGNVVGGFGAMALRKYAAGGIARSAQVSVFGEGSTPEAYVPLQDGRSIPVTVEGGGGGTNIGSINVHVATDGSSRVESDTSGKNAAALGSAIEQGVMGVIAREKRPGGLLYA